jgi:C4-dicarboxylate-specific signal transduction histidine kinase
MGELAASIAHEVNQPLCAIVSNAQALRRLLDAGDVDVGELREALGDIIQDGGRAGAVLARTRDFLKQGPADHAPVAVNALIGEMAALLRGQMTRRGVTVKLDLADALPAVLGQPVELQQVILNLMVNGADAMHGTARERRRLVVRSTADESGTVKVSVSDAGAGIDPRHLDRVFEPFFTTKPGGLGMGLAICKSIIAAHKGTIAARANGGGGTTFAFTLPGMERGPT